MATYPLIGEVVHARATYRDFLRGPDWVCSIRIRVVRPCGPQYPDHYWMADVIETGLRQYLGMTLIVSEGAVYKLRTGRDASWAGKAIVDDTPAGSRPWASWLPRPDGHSPYGGLQTP